MRILRFSFAALLALSPLGLGAQVHVELMPDGRTVYWREATDPAFVANQKIGRPPRGVDPQLWWVYDPYIIRYSQEFGVDPVLAKAVVYVESGFNWRATSRARAKGLMQLMDGTAKSMGHANPGEYDPIENIRCGIRYLAVLQNHYSGNLILIAAGYNAGQKAVDKHRGIPPFEETRAYVPKVLNVWNWISGAKPITKENS